MFQFCFDISLIKPTGLHVGPTKVKLYDLSDSLYCDLDLKVPSIETGRSILIFI